MNAEAPRADFEKIGFENISTDQLRAFQTVVHKLYGDCGDLFWKLKDFLDRLDTEILRRTT